MQFLTTLFTFTILSSPFLAVAIPILTTPPSAGDLLIPAKRAACSADVQKLVDGINSNIAVQKQEASQATVLASILSADTIDQSDFDSAKSKMTDIVNKGITIRKNNQKIAPSGNKAIDGLGKVATAQSDELKLVKGLTADKNGAADVKTLKTDFANGIKQNQQNAKDAANGCTAN